MTPVQGAVRRTAYQRFQGKLRQLLAERDKTDPKAKTSLASHCRNPPNWVSNLLNPRAETPRIGFDELECIADFFRVSVNDLFRPANPKDLSADEQRVLLAFRSLPEPTQDHFLAILEAASLNALLSAQTLQTRTGRSTTKAPVEPRRGDPVPSTDPATEVQQLRAFLSHVSLVTGSAATGALPDRPLPSALPPQATGGRVAD